ncbi:urate hydroxylase PuuD [Candidatus Halocynthiibacter alkanivorans]|uniref:urate hydroxylase PuuD n=1 Tax=Candidatus Halocynthiibacter alkanivorans TaxID=2267619 RepID=UPI001F3E4703|nr:urate hydroxylase PuuD [Candidatus Halocynthiibacter alkanivorans]
MEQAQPGVRWLQVITVLGWTGSLLDFIAPDLWLRPTSDPGARFHGKEWQMHGGGFWG